jgi:hypothetical protein
MKKILVLFAAFFMFSAVNVYAQTMSKYGYPVGYEANSKPAYYNSNKPKNYSIDSIINSINIYYENDYFHYGEYTPNLPGFYSASQPAGSYLDGEHIGFHGWGISFQNILTKQVPIWYKASYSYLPGSGTYDEPVGITNIGHSSDMSRYGFRLGYVFHIGSRIALIPNFGYEWVNWNRNIPGLNSDYYHLNYYMIGLKGYYIPPVLNNNLWIEGEAYYLNDIHDTVDIGFTGPGYVYEAPYITDAHYNFTMAPKAGYILGAKIGYTVLKYKNISVSPYLGFKFSQNKMGRSNINTEEGYIINGNVYAASVTEPSDQYNQIFLQFGLKFGF